MDRVSGARASKLTSEDWEIIRQLRDKRYKEHLASLSESEQIRMADIEKWNRSNFLRDVDGTSVEVMPEKKRT